MKKSAFDFKLMHDFFLSRLTVCLYCVIKEMESSTCVRSNRASDYEWNQSNLVFRFFIFSCLSDFFFGWNWKQNLNWAWSRLEAESVCAYMIDNMQVCLGTKRSSAGNKLFFSIQKYRDGSEHEKNLSTSFYFGISPHLHHVRNWFLTAWMWLLRLVNLFALINYLLH